MVERWEERRKEIESELRGIQWPDIKDTNWDMLRRMKEDSEHSQIVAVEYSKVEPKARTVLELIYMPGYDLGYQIGWFATTSTVGEDIRVRRWPGPPEALDIFLQGVETGLRQVRANEKRRLEEERQLRIRM